jgi:type IV secretory pathway TrbL component
VAYHVLIRYYYKKDYTMKSKLMLSALILPVLLAGCATTSSLNKVAQANSSTSVIANKALSLAEQNSRASEMAMSKAEAAQSTADQALSSANAAHRQATMSQREESRMFKKSMMK